MNLTALNEPVGNLCANKMCEFSFFPYGITTCDAAFLFGVFEVSILIFLLYWVFCKYRSAERK